MRRPEYVPRGYTYTSAHARKTRTRFRRGERRRSPWLVIALVVLGLLAVAAMAVAWRHLDREAAAGWPQPGRNVHTIPAPGRSGGLP